MTQPLIEQSGSDRTPPSIDVWVCPQCGYWRGKKETGIHMDYAGTGPGERHPLVKARYIFEGEVDRAA